MALRTLLVFIGSAGLATTTFAQVGTKKEVIQAAKKSREPAYIKELLEQMSKEIRQSAATKNLQDPTEKLAWLHTMAGILDVIHHATVSSASYVIEGVPYRGHQESGLKRASRVASEAAAYCSGSKVWEDVTAIVNDAAWFYAYLAAVNEAKDVAGVACSPVCEWGALNWLLDNIGTVVENAYWRIVNTMRQNLPSNSFPYEDFLIAFYDRFFANLDQSAMRFLVPWLIHIIPIDVAGPHRPQFLHLMTMNRYTQGELAFFWASWVPNNPAMFPQDIARLVLSISLQLDAPRCRTTKSSRSCVLF